MTAVFEKILEMSLTAAVVIVVVLAIRLLLRKAPRKYSYALWAVAAFRLVCPVSFRSVFSIFALTERVKIPEGGQAVAPPVTTIAPDAMVTIPPAAMTQPPAVVTTPPAVTVTPPAVTEPITSVVSFWDVVTVIWLVVLAGLLVYGVASYVSLRRRMANAILLEGNVYQSDRVRSPFILGFVRPKIYLPFGLTEEQRSYVLSHERYHIRRLDHIVRPLAFLILAVHWFNPLVWVGYYLMGRDMEMSCDEKVLGGADNIRKAYSITLLSFAANRRFPSPSPLAFGETGVKGRIKNILSWKKPALWVTIIAVIVVIAVILVCAADPREPSDGITREQEGEYRTVECIYLTPLSSYYAPDGDDGYDYTITSNHVTRGDQQLEVTSDWEELTEDRWNDMDFLFWDAILKEKVGNYQSQRMLSLSDDWYLMEMDGELWIAKLSHDPNGRSYFWSIYRLGKEGENHWSNEEPPSDEYISYVSVKCVYQLPSISAIYPDDSGKIYLIGENKAAILDKEGRDEGSYFSDLPPWQELTAEEWKKLFWAGFEPDISSYQEPRIRWLSEGFALADLDGTLWILLLPELEGGVSDTVFFAYELAPVNEGEPSPTGWYRSVECVFMNGLSSSIPMNGDSGYSYGIEGDTLTLVHNGSLPTIGGDHTGYSYSHRAEGGWQVLTEEKWGEMTDATLVLGGATLWETIGKYEERYIRRYENTYFLLSLDGELWLGRSAAHPNGEGYIWDLWRLTPADAPTITVERKASFTADLNHDGSAEILTVSYDRGKETYKLTVEESMGMNILLEWEHHRMEHLSGGYYLYTREGKDYLLWWNPSCWQDVWNLSYEVISFDEKGGHVVLEQGARQYDASHIGMEHLTADLDDLRAFEREINSLLVDSVPILAKDWTGGRILIGGQGGPILWTSPADEWEQAQQKQADTELLAEWQADLTHDGQPEWIRVVGIQRREDVPDDWYFYEVRVQNEAGTYTYWTGEADSSHVGWNGIYLYQKDGKDYLMTWVPYGSTGIYSLSYSVFSLTPDGEELALAANEMEYDTMPNLMDVDVSAIRAFEDEVNALLKDAFVLVDNTNNGIAQYSTAGNKIVNQCSGYADYVEQLQAQQNTEQ